MSVSRYAHFFMTFSQNLSSAFQQTAPSLSNFSELIDLNWIEDCLKRTGKASVRKRKLPAEHAVWLVIGLALFRDQPIWYVVQQLQLVFGTAESCAPSASVQARQRLGLEPLNVLFNTLSQTWFEDSQPQYSAFHGLSICAVDGAVWSMPHTDENFRHFGSSKGKTIAAPWPQARAVCLINTNTHEVIDAGIGSMDQGELTLAKKLKVPANSLTLFDRAYFSADFLSGWQSRENCHWLMRAKDNLRYEIIRKNSAHDFQIRMPVSPRAKKLNPDLGDYWEARLIETEQSGRVRRYVTSLLDSKAYPLEEVSTLYAQRWEIEMCYREIKSDLQDGMHLRSKQPELVYQELWGVLIAYNILRRQMKFMAQRAKVSPLRISFHIASISIINILRHTPLESAGNLPKHLERLLEQSKMFVLPERRSRQCPRVVKIKPQKYPRKCQSIS
ncbi:transposase, IS4 family [Acinetobacter johnsonii SH046]|jgi:hypothetical protein|uniref:Transposase, IS4 family n=14 Tax=Acinetobacter TaxID=469 RepID=D0SHM1_ACIJO|nr:IS4 family transposase [Acinetobacter johnsonii]EEY94559.1 transposase, IS4 family [Acinetobacter johnsonii SH046]MDG9799025.1 IS4 family transposase [Acinetobacter johnsonii]MDH0657873.1 IS4 family transposase [Acinetobacter johnsonii]SFT26924.1 Insertion element 4 transposase N-terminal [Acinetobacter bohemicus]